MSYDPASGGYILVKEKTPLGIFQTDVDFGAGTASNGSADTENSTDLFDPALAGVADFGDVYALSNTLPETATDYADLLVLSQESGMLLKMDRSGTILSRLDVGTATQHEGVTADENNVLYLANELGGGADHPQIWVYTPTTSTDAVGIVSRIYLSFEVAVTAASGSFTIGNGGDDVRAVAIDHSDQVSIDGGTTIIIIIIIDLSEDLLPGTGIPAPAGLVLAADSDSQSAALTTSFTTRNETVPPRLIGAALVSDAMVAPAGPGRRWPGCR